MKRIRQKLVWSLDWTWLHLKEVASVLTVTSLYRVAVHTLPDALRSSSALRKATKCVIVEFDFFKLSLMF